MGGEMSCEEAPPPPSLSPGGLPRGGLSGGGEEEGGREGEGAVGGGGPPGSPRGDASGADNCDNSHPPLPTTFSKQFQFRL